MAKILHPRRNSSTLLHHRTGNRTDHPTPLMMKSVRTAFHGLLCIFALILGFRLSGSASFLLHVSSSSPSLSLLRGDGGGTLGHDGVADDPATLKFPYIPDLQRTTLRSDPNQDGYGVHDSSIREGHDVIRKNVHDDLGDGHENVGTARGGHDVNITHGHDINGKSLNSRHGSLRRRHSTGVKSTRVHVGRHEILIRPWPHPDPLETMKAHKLLGTVQHQQRILYGSVTDSSQTNLLVITPTYVRTFQTLHMMSVIHTLRNVPDPLTWIVIEAGGVSDETASLLMNSRLSYHHLGFMEASIPSSWNDRIELEARLRAEGLSFIRRQQLEGIVMFVDDSNAHSLELFEETRKTKWLGAFAIGLLEHSGTENLDEKDYGKMIPVQGPKCDRNGHIIGWYTPKKVKDMSDLMGRNVLEWVGFSFNARLLWEDQEIPRGLRSWNDILSENNESVIQSPLEFVSRNNISLIEPLGNCGHDVLLWSQRVEARPDSKFPSKWVINPQLEVVVPSKRTPWPKFRPLPQRNDPLHSSDAITTEQRRRSKGKVRQRVKKGSGHNP